MPTQHRSVRVDDDRWRLLGDRTAERQSSRGEVINEFIAWYLREKNARLPERPATPSA
jgi:hypothetical protein